PVSGSPAAQPRRAGARRVPGGARRLVHRRPAEHRSGRPAGRLRGHPVRGVRLPSGPVAVTVAELPEFADVTEDYRLAVHPTTVLQYWHYLLDSGQRSAPDPRLHGFPPGTGLRLAAGGAIEFDEAAGALPATGISWHGAQAYCGWLAARLGIDCRLPTAAEWYLAAAGPDRLRWALGNE